MGDLLDLQELDRSRVAEAGGKGAQLGELARIEGVTVPPGFVVTTAAFRRHLTGEHGLSDALDGLSRLGPADREGISAASAALRGRIEETALSGELAAAITDAVAGFGEGVAFAVRSSATAEDLPGASFAGQHDSSLDVVGAAAVLQALRRCWASLYTERAVTYRLRQGFDPRAVEMAVVVQRMAPAEAAGVLFTADPRSGNRRVATVEAVRGLGEALVSGRAHPDTHTLRDGQVTRRPAGPEPVLSDAELIDLVALGRRVEAAFGQPQDIEWCLARGAFQLVQSRPISTLFPLPLDDGQPHVWLSVGHQQMMTDAMRPFGLSLFQLLALRPMITAGGRLFVDVTRELGAPSSRADLFAMAGRSDPLVRDALETVLTRDLVPTLPDPPPRAPPSGPAGLAAQAAPLEADIAVVEGLMARDQASLAALRQEIGAHRGPALFDFLLEDIPTLKRQMADPEGFRALMAGIEATWWLNDQLGAWLGEKSPADALAQSAPHNITSEMGLALLDVADALRPHPAVLAALQQAEGDDTLDALPALPGGEAALAAIQGWLLRYGMRCPGEIDITRPRWAERPSQLIPLLLSYVRTFEAGAGRRRFEQGLEQSAQTEGELLRRLQALPDGEQKVQEVRRMIRRLRTFTGYREYPKYAMISRLFVYKQAIWAELRRLVEAGALSDEEDGWYLSFPELHALSRGERLDASLVTARREAYRLHQGLRPPRVLTSEGEALFGRYRREGLPAGTLVGLGVSAGVAVGRARVALDMATADLEPGDILVTPFTDPSWTPLFVTVAGLVTEVGGLTSHGSVIAREYGLPAVVGVEGATLRIQDGQRIRVDGAEGTVEVLD
jgi:phosphoenolpyruvate synthase/pyruvate phosphate dikinase